MTTRAKWKIIASYNSRLQRRYRDSVRAIDNEEPDPEEERRAKVRRKNAATLARLRRTIGDDRI